ncbi:MAG: sigma factor [Thermostichus sp. BF3_bins_97]
MNAWQTAELVARDCYGRLLAYLAAHSPDWGTVEDALGDALLRALETWPEKGIPQSPEAWLLTVARRRLIDGSRRSQVQSKSARLLYELGEQSQQAAADPTFPDERLKLLFVCAHPAIDPMVRTPLMLQTVLGLKAAHIASAFLVSPATMGQRLVRAKHKIRDAGIPFQVPSAKELPERLSYVLQAIYAAYNSGWQEATGTDRRLQTLAPEAIRLARIVVQLLPEEPEARGLLALMLYCQSRYQSRSQPHYVPLSEQDVTLWDPALIAEAEAQLRQAATYGIPGRFQLEAAIQSAHAQRRCTGQTAWQAIALLYEGLIQIAPTLGARVSQAAAIAEAEGAETGLALLERIPLPEIQGYQPYWAVRAHLLAQLGHPIAAQEAYARAIGLSESETVRQFLLNRCSSLEQATHPPEPSASSTVMVI